MPVKDINLVVAENLRHWMKQREPVAWTQEELGAKAGVAQKTISNYLNPQQRVAGATGKQGSPKLFELNKIAEVLGVELWQLTRQMTPRQRTAYEAIERAYQQLQIGVKTNEQEGEEPNETDRELMKALQAEGSQPIAHAIKRTS